MKTAISLPNDLFDRAEAAAKDLGMSRSKLIQTALEEFLRKRHEEAIVASINRYLDKHGAEPSEEDEAWLAHGREQLRRVEWDE
jgi:metal-responsive CopG/Arc/MetJ family transcriptional regulator